jgi:hypothetical protein
VKTRSNSRLAHKKCFLFLGKINAADNKINIQQKGEMKKYNSLDKAKNMWKV